MRKPEDDAARAVAMTEWLERQSWKQLLANIADRKRREREAKAQEEPTPMNGTTNNQQGAS